MIETLTEGGIPVFVFKGHLIESSDFRVVLTALQSQPKQLCLDLGGITRTNSVGVREWLLFLEQVPQTCTLIFRNVSRGIIEQANIVPNMLGRSSSQVQSFHVPYVCPQCGANKDAVIKSDQVKRVGAKFIAPSFDCAKCQKEMELDWLEDQYFQFLKRTSA